MSETSESALEILKQVGKQQSIALYDVERGRSQVLEPTLSRCSIKLCCRHIWRV